jgi:hypothetical protein
VDRAGNKSVEMAICEVEYKLYRDFEVVDWIFWNLGEGERSLKDGVKEEMISSVKAAGILGYL